MSNRFNELAYKALESDSLSDEAKSTLRQILRVRNYKSREINLFDETPSTIETLEVTPRLEDALFDETLYNIHLLVNTKLGDSSEKAARASAVSGDPIDSSDLTEIFKRKIKYVSQDHLLFLLQNDIKKVVPSEDTEALSYIHRELNGKPKCKIVSVRRWKNELDDYGFKLRVVEHIFYWRKRK